MNSERPTPSDVAEFFDNFRRALASGYAGSVIFAYTNSEKGRMPFNAMIVGSTHELTAMAETIDEHLGRFKDAPEEPDMTTERIAQDFINRVRGSV